MASAGKLDIVYPSGDEIETVRELWREYWNALGMPDEFQSFGEELKGLPGAYAAPRGRLLLARVAGDPAGTGGLRPIDGRGCEVKRLYVRPEYRGLRVGRRLLECLVKEAQIAGYKEMFGDTLPSMRAALEMYRQFGFTEVPAYSAHPTPGAIFLKLTL